MLTMDFKKTGAINLDEVVYGNSHCSVFNLSRTKTNIFCGFVIFKRMTFHEYSLIKIGLAYMAMFEKSYSNVKIHTKTAQIEFFWTLGIVL